MRDEGWQEYPIYMRKFVYFLALFLFNVIWNQKVELNNIGAAEKKKSRPPESLTAKPLTGQQT